MNPDPTLTALGLPLNGEPNDTYDSVVSRIQTAVSQFDAAAVDDLFVIKVALNYYSQWLVRSCGTYPENVWNELWSRHGSPAMQHLLPATMRLLHQNDANVLFNPAFFESRRSENLGATFIQVKPIAQFPNKEVELHYTIGTRGSGVDQPRWPHDLTSEVVTGDN